MLRYSLSYLIQQALISTLDLLGPLARVCIIKVLTRWFRRLNDRRNVHSSLHIVTLRSSRRREKIV